MKMPFGIDLMAYTKGGFKVTIKNSRNVWNVIKELDSVLNFIGFILKRLYNRSDLIIECNFTQVVSILHWNYNTGKNFKLNYTRIVKDNTANNNQLKWIFNELTFTHRINWVTFETGTSSIFLSIHKNDKKLASFKVYVNLKVVLFTYDLAQLNKLSHTIPHFIKKHLLVNSETTPEGSPTQEI